MNNPQDQLMVVIVQNMNGHRDAWVKLIQEECDQRGITLKIMNFDSAVGGQHKVSKNQITRWRSNIRLRWHFYQKIRSLSLHRDNISFAFIDGDQWVPFLLLKIPNSKIILMRPYLAGTDALARIRHAMKILLSIILRLKGYEFGLLSIPGFSPKILPSNWVNDIPLNINSNNQFKEKIALDDTLPMDFILVPGFIEARKNPLMVIEAFKIFMQHCDDVSLVFAGRISSEVQSEILKQFDPRICLLNKYLSEEEYLNLLLKARLIILAYSNRGSSGIVLEATALGTPVVIAGDKNWNNAVLKSEGKLYPVTLTAQSIADVVTQIYIDSPIRRPVEIRNMKNITFIEFLFCVT